MRFPPARFPSAPGWGGRPVVFCMGMTRKEGKGYLGSDFGRQAAADSTDALELVHAAEWTERIAISDNARGKRGADSAQRLDLYGGGDVDVDDSGRRRRIRCLWRNEMDCTAFLASSLSFCFSVARAPTDRIHSLDLGIQRSLRCGIHGRLAVEDRDAPRASAEKDYAA